MFIPLKQFLQLASLAVSWYKSKPYGHFSFLMIAFLTFLIYDQNY